MMSRLILVSFDEFVDLQIFILLAHCSLTDTQIGWWKTLQSWLLRFPDLTLIALIASLLLEW